MEYKEKLCRMKDQQYSVFMSRLVPTAAQEQNTGTEKLVREMTRQGSDKNFTVILPHVFLKRISYMHLSSPNGRILMRV